MLLRLEKIDVSRRNDANQLAPHFAVFRDGDTAEAVAGLGLKDVLHEVVRAHHHRVCDEALLVPLQRGEKHGRERDKNYISTGQWTNGTQNTDW